MKWEAKTKRCKLKNCKQKFLQKNPYDTFCSDDCKRLWIRGEWDKRKKKLALKKHKPLKRSRIKQIGKIGKRNINANKIINRMFEKSKTNTCEIMFEGCTGKLFLTNAHKHKREWYRPAAKQKLLYSHKEVIRACQYCHDTIEVDKELTENIFNQLRP